MCHLKRKCKSWLLLSIGIILISLMAGCNADNNVSPKDTDKVGGPKDDNQQQKEISDPTEQEGQLGPTLFRDNSKAIKKELNTGIYTVGIDIEAGRYRITAEGNGTLIIKDEKGDPKVNEVIGENAIGVSSITMDLESDDTVEIAGVDRMAFIPADTKLQEDTLTTGSWIVGLDIVEGVYLIKSVGEKGNLIIYNAEGFPFVNEILGGEDGAKQVSVTLKNGYKIIIGGIEQISIEKTHDV